MPRVADGVVSVFCPLHKFSKILGKLHKVIPVVWRSIPSAVCLLLLFTSHPSFVSMFSGATATLSGTVTDQTGAVIPGVNIAVISIEQGFQRTTTTNNEGIFVVPFLPPGNYIVKAEHQYFNTVEPGDLILNTNDYREVKIPLQAKRTERRNCRCR